MATVHITIFDICCREKVLYADELVTVNVCLQFVGDTVYSQNAG